MMDCDSDSDSERIVFVECRRWEPIIIDLSVDTESEAEDVSDSNSVAESVVEHSNARATRSSSSPIILSSTCSSSDSDASTDSKMSFTEDGLCSICLTAFDDKQVATPDKC